MEAIMRKVTLKWLIGLVCIGLAFSAGATTWTYNSEDSTITDGQWTIIVNKDFKTTQTLKMSQRLVQNAAGKNTWVSAISGWQEPTEPDLSGILDLRSPLEIVCNAGEDTQETVSIRAVEIGQAALSGTALISYTITKLYCDIISGLGTYDTNSKQWQGTCFALNKGLTTVEIGGASERLPSLLFKDCSALKALKFNFPNARLAGHSYGQVVISDFTSLAPIDVSTVVAPGITNIYKNAFMCSKLCGDLTLTNIMSIGASAFQGASLTNVYLAGTLTGLPDQVFRGNSTITNVVLDLPDLTTIAYQAFGHPNSGLNQTKIRRVEFVSAIKDMGLVTNIVRYANNTNIGDLRIYVSKKQWTPSDEQKYDAETKPAGFFSEIKDEEKAALDAETQKNIIGVLVKGGTRKGIFIHKASIHDKKQGFAISIR